jgi:hypothetical protein
VSRALRFRLIRRQLPSDGLDLATALHGCLEGRRGGRTAGYSHGGKINSLRFWFQVPFDPKTLFLESCVGVFAYCDG